MTTSPVSARPAWSPTGTAPNSGSHPSSTEKIPSSSIPSQKIGVESRNITSAIDPMSDRRPRRHAADTPSAVPSTLARRIDVPTNASVHGSRSRMTLRTGSP